MSGIAPVVGLPGLSSVITSTPRIVFKGGVFDYMCLPQGKLIDGSKARDSGNTGNLNVLRAGLLLGKITSGGLYAPTILGVTSGSYTSGGTTLTVSAAQAVEIARRVGTSGTGTLKAIGPPTAAGTVASTSVTFSAINTTSGAITVTSLGVDKIAGTFITAADGSETPIVLIPDTHGILVTTPDGGTNLTVPFPQFPIAGTIISSQIINWPTDTSIQAWIRTNLSTASAGKFVFDDQY